MSGDETVVASIVGYLRMDDTDWSRTIDRAKAKARELAGINPTITVKVDDAAAEAKLSLLQKAKTALSQGRAEIKVDADTAAARAQLGQLDSSVGQSSSALSRYRAALSSGSGESDKAMRAAAALANAHRSLQNSAESVAAAEQRVAVAQERIRASGAGTVEDYRRLDAAQRSLNSALRGSESAYDRVRLASKRFNDEAGALPTAAGGSSPQAMLIGIAAAALLVGPAVGAGTAALSGFVGAAGTAFAVYKGFQQEIKDGTPIGLQLQGALSGVGGELTHLEEIAANSASGGVLAMLDKLHAAIPGLEPEIASLAAHLGRALNIATPGVISIAKQLGPILNDTGVDAEHLAQGFTNFANSPQFHQFLDYARRELPIVASDLKDFATTGVEAAVALQPLGDELLRDADALAKVANFVGRFRGEGDALKTVLLPGVQILDLFGHKAKQAAQSQQDQAAAALEESVAQNQANVALSNGYDKAVAFATAYDTATQAIHREKDQLAASTQQMKLQDDAAGLLTAALDKLNGGNQSAAQAQNQFDQDLVNMAKHVHGADAALGGMSSSAVKNRGDLITLATGASQAAEAYGKMTDANGHLIHGSEDSRQKLISLRKQLIDNAAGWGEDKAQVTALVDSILNIPPKATTHGVLETTEAEDRLAAYKAKLASLAGMAPVTTVHARVDGALASIRSVVEYAANHPAVIHVTTMTSSGAVTGGRQVATGGYISGPGSGTSDSIPARLSNGEFVVKASATARHRAFLEQLNNGYAAGGLVTGYSDGGIVSLTPTRASTAAAKSKAAKKAKAAKAVVVPLTITAGGGQAYGLASYIKGQIGSARQATRELSAAVNDAFQLKGIQAKLAAAKAGLANLQTARTDLRGMATGALQGVDPSQYGDAADLASVYQNKSVVAGQFAAEVRKLSAEHLTGSLLAQLAGKGPSAGLDALAAAGPGQIAQLNKAYAGYIGSTSTAGSVAANTVYNPGIAADQRAVSTYTAQSARAEAAMIRAVATVGQLLNRPVKVMIGNKEVAHAVIESSEFQGVFDDLARTISYSRKR